MLVMLNVKYYRTSVVSYVSSLFSQSKGNCGVFIVLVSLGALIVQYFS